MEGNKRDVFEVFIRDELEREAEEIRRENEAEGKKMPEALKAEIRSNLDERIEMLKWEKKYPNLSADELRALCVAQKILDREKEEGAEKTSAGWWILGLRDRRREEKQQEEEKEDSAFIQDLRQ